MDYWQKFNETTFPEKEKFDSNLNIANIKDVDYMHGKRVFKDFEIKNLGISMIYISKVIHYFRLMFLKTLEECV